MSKYMVAYYMNLNYNNLTSLALDTLADVNQQHDSFIAISSTLWML